MQSDICDHAGNLCDHKMMDISGKLRDRAGDWSPFCKR
ncbi:hypothetical protein Z949_522 [Sulfitobacter guttiformis KCTC 32187]|nr:hypothetical protein Z949_522 [Sulfitobacter guttiformis KCTC 32187]